MQLGFIGLGKMGRGMVKRLKEAGHEVVAHDLSRTGEQAAKELGVEFVNNIPKLLTRLRSKDVILRSDGDEGSPKHSEDSSPTAQNDNVIVWLMVPAPAVGGVVRELEVSGLEKNDVVVDGGNSLYKDSARYADQLKKNGIHFVDVGVSGGPGGVERGFCLMVGGKRAIYDKLTPLFDALAQKDGYGYMGSSGSGHYVKMVHNGVEYGMMQSIAEGFELLATGPYKNFDLHQIASVWNHGSVVASFLVEMVERAVKKEPRLETVVGEVAATGEGEWSIQAAKECGVDVDSMKLALQKRLDSQKNPDLQDKFGMKLLAAMRGEFGGHEVKRKLKVKD